MLTRKLFRTMRQYKAQFLSMIIMITLGIGIFVAFNVEWYTIEKNTFEFFDDTGFADYRIVSTQGYTKDEALKIAELYGEENTTRFVSVNTQVEEKDNTLGLTTIENEDVSGFIVKEGEAYQSENTDGIWLSEKYATVNDIVVGDTLELSCNGAVVTVNVNGLIQSSEYMICVQDETQILPDYSVYGYAYISPKMFEKIYGNVYYPQIHVITDDSKSDFSSKVNDALGVTSLVLTKDESVSYAGSQGEVEEGKMMGSMLPVLFLLIAVLTMITTMYRITNKEQVQIGTLKALGFKNRKILVHYTYYAVIIGILGSVFGVIIGYVLAYIIVNPGGSMGTYLDMPDWGLKMPQFGYIVLLSIFLLLLLVGIVSVSAILKRCPAEILRQTSSKKIKPLKLEKSNWFHRQSFGTRWNLRDVLHNKIRTAMSLIGVVGCMVILIVSLGMKDTMNEYLDIYYNGVMQYNSKVYFTDEATAEQKENLIDIYQSDTSASVGVKIKEQAVALDIYNIENDHVRFMSVEDDYVTLDDKGAYICKRIADKYELNAGDSLVISPYGQDQEYTLEVKGIISSMSENIVISQEYADFLEIEYLTNVMYTDAEDIEDVDDVIKSVQSKNELINSFDVMVEIMDTMVIMLIVVGLILSIVVLYNLGVMGYTERYREMATLKVLGFKDKKISALLTSQNMWLAIIGILIGIPLGYYSLEYLLNALASEYEMKLVISWSTYMISIALNLGVALLVSFMISRKNKDIDMVEALKSAE